MHSNKKEEEKKMHSKIFAKAVGRKWIRKEKKKQKIIKRI